MKVDDPVGAISVHGTMACGRAIRWVFSRMVPATTEEAGTVSPAGHRLFMEMPVSCRSTDRYLDVDRIRITFSFVINLPSSSS